MLLSLSFVAKYAQTNKQTDFMIFVAHPAINCAAAGPRPQHYRRILTQLNAASDVAALRREEVVQLHSTLDKRDALVTKLLSRLTGIPTYPELSMTFVPGTELHLSEIPAYPVPAYPESTVVQVEIFICVPRVETRALFEG